MPPRRVFVSCSHRQGDWVWDRLVPPMTPHTLDAYEGPPSSTAARNAFRKRWHAFDPPRRF